MPRQTNFSGGELAPGLWGRTDHASYAKGLRTAKNFFINREGSAVSRPGMAYVGATQRGRLVPYIYSDADSYVIHFGPGYINFYRNGANVLVDGSLAPTPNAGLSLALTSPYALADLPSIQWVQTGSTLTITHVNHPARELKRSAFGVWTLTDVDFSGIVPRFVYPGGTYSATAPALVDDGTLFSYDAAHPPREWRWMVSATLKDTTTGASRETTAINVDSSYNGTALPLTTLPTPQNVVLYPDRPIKLRWPPNIPVPAPAYGGSYATVAYNYYRGRGGLFGFVGRTTEQEFTDDGREPDYLVQPAFSGLTYSSPSPFLRPGFADAHPISTAYFQERRVFAGTDVRPETVYASASGNYNDFGRHDVVQVPGESIEFELASRTQERTQWSLGAHTLLIGTSASVWSMTGTDSQPLDFDSVQAMPVDSIGSTCLRALPVGNSVFYVRSKGRGVRELSFDKYGWQGRDVSYQSRHLFLGGEVPYITSQPSTLADGHTRQIVSWCYAHDPWGVIWAVRNDGVLLSASVLPDGEVAWTHHETDGFVHSICSVPEGSEDAVYALVQRNNTRPVPPFFTEPTVYLERMTSRVENGGPEDNACLDACLRYQGPVVTTFTNLWHLEGRQVYVVAVGNAPYGPLTVTGGQVTIDEVHTANCFFTGLVGASIVVDSPGVVAFIGLLYTCDLESLDDADGGERRVKQKTVTHVGFEVDQSKGLWVGQDLEHLIEWRQRSVTDSYGPPSAATAVVKVPVRGTWDFFARAALRQTLPLPVTVLGLVREVDNGG